MANILMALLFSGLSMTAQAATTASGIPLDTDWKNQVYEFAKKTTIHPAWGVPHAERNYHVTLDLAAKEGFVIDEEILFAASFLHDVGGFAPYFDGNVDHGVKSAEVVVPLLKKWGFPAAKIEAVKELIIGHVYYKPAPANKAAQAFRDADILDFMGAIGIARLLAITPETSPSLAPSLNGIKNFMETSHDNCSLNASRAEAKVRAAQMQNFLNDVNAQGLQGKAL